jgi:hypothetical protein
VAGVATGSFVVEILVLDLEHPQPTVEADLDLGPVRTANPHLDSAAALALAADHPGGPDGAGIECEAREDVEQPRLHVAPRGESAVRAV